MIGSAGGKKYKQLTPPVKDRSDNKEKDIIVIIFLDYNKFELSYHS